MPDSIVSMASSLKKRWPVLAMLSGVLLAIAPLGGSYLDPGLPSLVFQSSFWAAIALLLALGVAWAVDLWFQREVTENFRSIRRDELRDLVPFYDRIIGGDRPSINDLKEIYNANNQVFRVREKVVQRGQRKKTTLVGFCTIVPMSLEAEALLAQEQLDGVRMNRAHILRPGRSPRIIYIGSIGGDGATAKAAVLNYVLGVIDDCASRGVNRVYTRPVTQDGLRVARKYGFRPVKNDVVADELRRLYFLDLGDRFEAVRRRRAKRAELSPATEAA
jgi:hypothetical protein